MSNEIRSLIAQVAEKSEYVTEKQIKRWRSVGAIPKAIRRGAGRGRGVRYDTAPGTVERVLVLRQYLKQNRSLDDAVVHMWLERIDDVSVSSFRRSLAKLVHVVPTASATLKEHVSNCADAMLRSKALPKGLAELGKSGELDALIYDFAVLAAGDSVDNPAECFSRFERITGFDAIRDCIPGLKPRSSSEAAEILELARNSVEDLSIAVKTATDDEFHLARAAYHKPILPDELVQQLRKADTFMFTKLSRSRDVIIFASTLLLLTRHPEFIKTTPYA